LNIVDYNLILYVFKETSKLIEVFIKYEPYSSKFLLVIAGAKWEIFTFGFILEVFFIDYSWSINSRSAQFKR